MNTPIVDFIKNYSGGTMKRFHVPGHKGRGEEDFSSLDITEIKGADVLYYEEGILEESQKNASLIFGTGKTLYSTEGSSLSIRAMTALIKMYAEKNGKKPVIAAARNAHKVFITSCALLDIEVDWLFPLSEMPLVSCVISEAELEAYLKNCSELPVAVYVTSPDYLGNISDIKGLSDVCRKYGVLLAVDNAHGAYLRFLPEDIHPISLGADICCDSAHKTLPVLTGGAYLHISEKAPEYILQNAKKAMALFASTSPSYLILASLDKANEILAGDFRKKIADLSEKISKMKAQLEAYGKRFIGNEPLKITLSAKLFGYSGYEVAENLRKNSIECEFCDKDFTVLMVSPYNTESEINHLLAVLMLMVYRGPIEEAFPVLKAPEKKMPIRDAFFAPSKSIDVSDSLGKILSDVSITCPPAVPVIVCGEVIDAAAIECFKYYGIERINIVDIEEL